MEDKPRVVELTEPSGPPLGLRRPDKSGGVGERDGAEAEGEPGPFPRQFGPFQLLALVHRTRMSVVYKAHQANPDRIVALKIPQPGRIASKAVREQFIKEIRLTAQLSSLGVVPVYEADEIDGTPYYTMPFIEGRPLAEHVEMEKLDLGARLDLFLKLCQVVQKLHAQRLVHLDLKPGNIMVNRDGDVCLLDFGISMKLEGADTDKAAVAGTPPYMAPEQTFGDREASPATDVHALGVILYSLLADCLPYPASAQTRAEQFRSLREYRPRPPSAMKRDLADRYDDLVLACLRKDPKTRPRSAGDVARLLEQVRAGERPVLPPVQSTLRRWRPAFIVLAACLIIGGLVLMSRPPTKPKDPWERVTADRELAGVRELVTSVPQHFRVELMPRNGPTEFVKGQGLDFTVRPERECLVALLLHSRDGTNYLLSAESSFTNRPAGRQPRDLPTKATVTKPFGVEVVQVIACTSAANLERLVRPLREAGRQVPREQYSALLTDALTAERVRGVDLDGKTNTPQWATAWLVIETREKAAAPK